MSAPACTWSEDSDGNYFTACGHAYAFFEGGPTDNGMRYCCYCGAALVEQEYSEEQDDALATD